MNNFSKWLIFLLLLSVSCEHLPWLNENKKAIAVVENNYLYLEDIAADLPKFSSEEDSLKFVRELATDWIKQKSIFIQAEKNLAEDKKMVEQKVQNYRQSLIMHAYESAIINQRLDTNINFLEIEDYYNNNQKDFELKDIIIKIRYVKLPKNAPKINDLKSALFASNSYDYRLVEDYCLQFASNYMLEDELWLYFNEVLREVPIQTNSPEQFLKNNKKIEIEDDAFVYLLYIADFRLKDNISPIEFEKEKISQIIMNQRKLDLINSLRKQIVEEAFNSGKAKLLLAN